MVHLPDSPSNVTRSRRWITLAPAAFLVFSGYPPFAMAGPIGAIDAMFTAMYFYIGIVLSLSLIAIVLLKFVPNRRLRALLRLLVVVFLYTPILAGKSFTPAFLYLVWNMLNPYRGTPTIGVFAHPIAMSYAIALAVTLPLLIVGMRFAERSARRGDGLS
jgi:hypothetical protein